MNIMIGIVISISAVGHVYAQACAVTDSELVGSYEGGCKNGKADGTGTAKGLATYVGEFRDGMKHGKGVKTWPWGDQYEGEFANDAKHGKGIYTWGGRSAWTGQRYEGNYINDKRNGFGIYDWPTGDRYTGPWKDDAMVGPPTPMMIARGRALKEHMIAMAKQNIKLCREATLGIGLRERIEGLTQGINPQTLQVAVKVTKLGESPLVIAGNTIKVGEIVWDEPLEWTLCH